MKRARGGKDQLTGGSGDVNPQILTISYTTPGDAPFTTEIPLPIPRFPTKEGYNLVMEFLAVDYYYINGFVIRADNGGMQNVIAITTNPLTPANIEAALRDARLIDAWYKAWIANSTAPIAMNFDLEWTQDLTDQAGHGILVASDKLFIHNVATATGQGQIVTVKLWYRWKTVTLTEYIGIVQSQQ